MRRRVLLALLMATARAPSDGWRVRRRAVPAWTTYRTGPERNRRRQHEPGDAVPGLADARPRWRGVRAAARIWLVRVRRDRERHGLRARRGDRRSRVVEPPGDARALVGGSVRRHLSIARNHEHAGHRPHHQSHLRRRRGVGLGSDSSRAVRARPELWAAGRGLPDHGRSALSERRRSGAGNSSGQGSRSTAGGSWSGTEVTTATAARTGGGWSPPRPTARPPSTPSRSMPDPTEGALWGGGNAPPVDAAGNVFVATGNRNGNSTSNPEYGDSVVKLNASASPLDWWAPPNWQSLDASDADLGSSMPTLLPGGFVFDPARTATATCWTAQVSATSARRSPRRPASARA